jgi:predicted nucleotidyltransferase
MFTWMTFYEELADIFLYNLGLAEKMSMRKGSEDTEMDQKRASDIVQFFYRCLKEKGIKVSKIVVFGSQARGTATEESDIDIVVISEEFKRKNIFRRANLTKDAEIRTIKKFMVPLDIISMTPEEYENRTSLAAEYAHEGEIVFAG